MGGMPYLQAPCHHRTPANSEPAATMGRQCPRRATRLSELLWVRCCAYHYILHCRSSTAFRSRCSWAVRCALALNMLVLITTVATLHRPCVGLCGAGLNSGFHVSISLPGASRFSRALQWQQEVL